VPFRERSFGGGGFNGVEPFGGDVFTRSPGVQTVRSGARRRRGPRKEDLQRHASGRTVLYAVDPHLPNAGIQQMPEGVTPGSLEAGTPAWVFDDQRNIWYPVKTGPRRRTMNPANHKATRRSIRRLDGAIRHAKELFRVDKAVKKTVKKPRRRKALA